MITRFEVPCVAPRWARGGHAQTVFGFLLPSPGHVLFEDSPDVRRIDLKPDGPGGDRIVTFEAPPLVSGPLEGSLVHLFHGLTGSSESNYMRLSAHVLRSAGARVVLFNHRGQGAGAGLSRGIYHSGSYPDLFASIERGRREHPGLVQIGVGFSLSANTLLLGAARAGEVPAAPDAVMAVNPPVDLSAAVDRIRTGFNRIYDRRFVRGMRQAVRQRQARGFGNASVVVPSGATIRDVDELVTAPEAGYESAAAYYEHCSSGPELERIRCPTVILSSSDDPFIAPDDFVPHTPGPRTRLHFEGTGGHLGYLCAGPSRRWLGEAVLHYVGQLLEAVDRVPDGASAGGTARAHERV